MSWWFPKKSRADELTARLALLQQNFAGGLVADQGRLSYLSERLAQAFERRDFPSAQAGRWLWVASQYRLHAGTDNHVASLAAAALVFFEEVLARSPIDEDDCQELNWILETATGRLVALVGPADLKSCLSADELARIDERLSRYEDCHPFDGGAILAAAQRQLNVIARLGSFSDWTSLSAKVSALVAAAARPGDAGAPARIALRYFAEPQDVVQDDVGVLGLLDDIYVIELAYAAIENQTLCLPILDKMSRRWPFVASLGLGASGAPLDRFARYVVCAALETLGTPGPGILVLRESGPFPIVAAVAAAVEAAIAQGSAFDAEMELWPAGCSVTIGDGSVTLRARWGGRLEGTARSRLRLHVADAGTIQVGEEVLPYLARAPREWKRLSNGSHIAKWLKDRNVDALVCLTGSGRRRPARHEAVLIVTSRTKLDRFFGSMRPQGLNPGALLGACWFDSHGVSHPLSGSTTDRPLVYACGDVGTASDLISNPPKHISDWRVIVDGAQPARTLHAALSAAGRLGRTRLCVFSELHEREGVSALFEQGVERVWYLEDHDVEVPPMVHPGRSNEADPLARFFARRSAHWTAAYSVRVGADPFLDAVAECLRRGDGGRGDNPMLNALDATVASFLRRATAHPLPTESDRRALQDLAISIVGQASVLAVYEPHAAEVRTLFGGYSAVSSGADRRALLLDLGASVGSEEVVAVVCRSKATAESCRTVAAGIDVLRGFEWTTMEGVRATAPYDRIVVPGWLGRSAMRELTNVGFSARTDMLLLPFEHQWYDKTISANRRWERRLERSTTRRLKQLIDTGFEAAEPRWREQAERRVELEADNDLEPIDDASEPDRAEARALDSIYRSLSSDADQSEKAKAQLVLFTDPGSFALLPPAGHVIVLPESGVVLGDGERRLLSPVSSLAPGMLTALPIETDRDLVDAWADRMLDDGGILRARANRWKVALKRHFAMTSESYVKFAQRLGEAGERRDVLTIKSWANDTRSVAPRNYRRMLPIIAKLVGDRKFTADVLDTVSAIDGVYRARAEAADAIVQEIFSGALDLTQPTISFDVDGYGVVYALARVERLAGIQEVPYELVGRRLRLGDLPTRSGVAA